MLPNVGFPSPETCASENMKTCIVVSKTDYAEMIAFVQALREWATDVRDCLQVQR